MIGSDVVSYWNSLFRGTNMLVFRAATWNQITSDAISNNKCMHFPTWPTHVEVPGKDGVRRQEPFINSRWGRQTRLDGDWKNVWTPKVLWNWEVSLAKYVIYTYIYIYIYPKKKGEHNTLETATVVFLFWGGLLRAVTQKIFLSTNASMIGGSESV